MELVSFLINLVVGCVVVYCIFLLLNWITTLLPIPAPIKTVILLIFSLFVLLWIFGATGEAIPRIKLPR